MNHKIPKEIDTPALVIDLPVMEKNIQTMAAYCKEQGLNLRPHIKSHKCPHIAKMQLDSGAIGVVCAKLGEAEVMAAAGVKPLLIANQIVGDIKLKRLLQLAGCVDITVCVAQLEHAKILAQAASKQNTQIKVFIEAEVGMLRCGLDSAEEIATLAKQIGQFPSLRLTGIMGYEGHAIGTKDLEGRREKSGKAHHQLALFANAIRDSNIELPVVSAVGTGTFNLCVSKNELTEIQPGSYCLMDSDYCNFENLQSYFLPAATVLTTIIDRPTATRVVLDVGIKGIAIDQGLPVPRWRSDLKPFEIHEEHYCLELEQPDEALSIGDRLELLPSHLCTTVNLYDQFHVVRDGKLVDIWPIAGRGKIQ